MDSFAQDFVISRSKDNRNMNQKQDSHDGPVMQNAAIKPDAAYHTSGYYEKDSMPQSCGSSLPGKQETSRKDRTSHIIIIDNVELTVSSRFFEFRLPLFFAPNF